MKNTLLKNTALMGVGLFGIACTSTVFAHEQGGTLGKSAAAVDYYQISCFDDGTGAADRLEISITDAPPVQAAILSLQVFKDNVAKNGTDLIDGDAAGSKEISLKGGNGEYYVMIDKTRATPEVYSLEYHCITATNEHTGTSISSRQNQ